MLDQFAYYHPQAYSRLLKSSLLLLLASASFTVGRAGSWRVGAPDFLAKPPASSAAAVSDAKPVSARPSATQQEVKPETTILPPFKGPASGTDPKTIAQRMVELRFGPSQWPALQQLWQHESGWNPNSRNPFSGACGIPQALPCSKISDHSPAGQIDWGLNYIANRYGTPSNALAHWQMHHWY